MLRFVKSTVVLACFVFSAGVAVAQDRARVIAVNHALHYFAERLLDDETEVVFPVPEGVDPSFWRPSIADISTIQSADLILLNGAGFAGWIDRVSLPRSRLVNTSASIEDQFIVTESITHSHGDGGEHSHEGVASYTWLDPLLATEQAKEIASAIVARGLANPEDVEPRLADLTSELAELDANTLTSLSSAQGVELIATHPRYQYFARRYGLTITSLDWEAGETPTQDQLAELERLAAELGARVLIWEAQPPVEATKAIEALGLQSVVFEPGASVVSSGALIDTYVRSITGLSQALGQISN